jgi:hypothetical protein
VGIKDLLLNKGWAGRTISRPETIERVNPIIRELIAQMHYYDSALDVLEGEARAAVEISQKTLRADIGKLCETVYSAGGVAPSGADMEPEDFRIDGDRASVVDALERAERAFASRVREESTVEHEMHTRAVLQVVLKNGESRLSTIRGLARG